jgi:hypothetical protein
MMDIKKIQRTTIGDILLIPGYRLFVKTEPVRVGTRAYRTAPPDLLDGCSCSRTVDDVINPHPPTPLTESFIKEKKTLLFS